jgi:hypothetical protein
VLPKERLGWQRWAPEIFPEPINGLYWMAYAEHHKGLNQSRLRVAFSVDPLGKFTPFPEPILQSSGIHHLDPQLVRHEDKFYLVEGSGWREGDGIRLWNFDMERIKVIGEPMQLVSNIPGDADLSLIEGGFLQIVPESKFQFQLHYCGNNFKTNYKSYLLVAENINGPYINPYEDKTNVFLDSEGDFVHPGQVSICNDRAIYHLVVKGKRRDQKGNFLRPAHIRKINRDENGLPILINSVSWQ